MIYFVNTPASTIQMKIIKEKKRYEKVNIKNE